MHGSASVSGVDVPAGALLHVHRAYGSEVEGEAVVSDEGFSPRYDLDRWSGIITKPGHKLEGTSIKDKICVFPTAKGGIAAGWAFHDIKAKALAPRAFIFGVANPVMVQGAVFADITITEGWDRDPHGLIRTGDWVRVDPARLTISVLRRAP
jgi:predicted aconitase with swiveling domain